MNMGSLYWRPCFSWLKVNEIEVSEPTMPVPRSLEAGHQNDILKLLIIFLPTDFLWHVKTCAAGNSSSASCRRTDSNPLQGLSDWGGYGGELRNRLRQALRRRVPGGRTHVNCIWNIWIHQNMKAKCVRHEFKIGCSGRTKETTKPADTQNNIRATTDRSLDFSALQLEFKLPWLGISEIRFFIFFFKL